MTISEPGDALEGGRRHYLRGKKQSVHTQPVTGVSHQLPDRRRGVAAVTPVLWNLHSAGCGRSNASGRNSRPPWLVGWDALSKRKAAGRMLSRVTSKKRGRCSSGRENDHGPGAHQWRPALFFHPATTTAVTGRCKTDRQKSGTEARCSLHPALGRGDIQ